MILKVLILAGALTAVRAGALISPAGLYGAWNPYSSYPAQPALASQQSNILRSPFNLGQISTYTKSIDTPFSSVRKADVRVSNPGISVARAYPGLGAPLVSHVGVGAPLVSHVGVGAPLVSHVGVAAPYAAPIAKVATTGGLLGVAYSAAPAVSHMTYSNGLGLSYAW